MFSISKIWYISFYNRTRLGTLSVRNITFYAIVVHFLCTCFEKSDKKGFVDGLAKVL